MKLIGKDILVLGIQKNIRVYSLSEHFTYLFITLKQIVQTTLKQGLLTYLQLPNLLCREFLIILILSQKNNINCMHIPNMSKAGKYLQPYFVKTATTSRASRHNGSVGPIGFEGRTTCLALPHGRDIARTIEEH